MKKTDKKAPKDVPSHESLTPLINRISGQISGVGKMVEEGRYCADILNQIRAARAALRTLEGQVLSRHLECCLKDAVQSGNAQTQAKKIDEIVQLIKRYE